MRDKVLFVALFLPRNNRKKFRFFEASLIERIFFFFFVFWTVINAWSREQLDNPLVPKTCRETSIFVSKIGYFLS